MRYADRVTITAGFVTAGQREKFSRRSFPAVKCPFFLDNNGGIDCFPAVHFPPFFFNDFSIVTAGKNLPPLRGGSIPTYTSRRRGREEECDQHQAGVLP